ncbi:alpha beta hydrolase [Lasallia pustulata]|uniref:Alpha beta hydrolase n=1 Tax=Lasallia pustulata TaxID=136370 RepID=A0A1W5D7G8_9LECA|nr:alpha beta hydrolase [Lasallia pustulata]
MASSKTMYPKLKQDFVNTSSGSKVCCYTSDLGHGPILTLIHGYPQSAFIWRHIIY